MHKSICSECGKACELPFRPTGDKPVFCSTCFGNKADSDRSHGKDFGKSSFHEKRLYPAICTGCGKTCEVPFRPVAGKPIYCNNCFRKGDATGVKHTEQYKKQFEIVNAKLDKILMFLTPIVSADTAGEQKKTRETGAPQLKKAAQQQAQKTVSPRKTTKKKAAAKKTVAKKVKRKKKH